MKPMHEVTVLPEMTITRNSAVNELFELAIPLGPNGLVVYGSSFEKSGRLDKLKSLQPAGLSIRYYEHSGGEPTLTQLQELIDFAQADVSLDWVAAIGGGSVLDLAKSAAGLVGAPESVVAYHDGAAGYASAIPFIAAPTTAGTGSEATPAAVFTNKETLQKKAIINAGHKARIVILDAELLETCPKSVIATAGMDALTQAIEAYASRIATPFTDALSLFAIKLIAKSLPAMFKGYDNPAAQDLLAGSYIAGVAFSNARLGVVHGLAHPIGSRTGAAHGLVCAVTLPVVLTYNRKVMGPKYDILSSILGEDAVAYVRNLNKSLSLANPITNDIMQHLDAITAETLASGVTKTNPREVSAQDVHDLLVKLCS